MRVLFLGRLRDLSGAAELTVDRPPPTLSALRAWLGKDNEALASALAQPSVRVAINQAIVAAGDADLREAREVAFLPPMSGG